MMINTNLATNKLTVLKELLNEESILKTNLLKENYKLGFVPENEDIVVILFENDEKKQVQPINFISNVMGGFFVLSTPYYIEKDKTKKLETPSILLLIESYEEELTMLNELSENIRKTQFRLTQLVENRSNIQEHTNLSIDDLLDLLNFAKKQNLKDWETDITKQLKIKTKEKVE